MRSVAPGPSAVVSVGFGLAVSAAVLVLPRPAEGYAEKIHRVIAELALPEQLRAQTVDGATRADLDAFRLWFYDGALEAGDARFLERYPTPELFSSAAFRELMGFTGDPAAKVWGFELSEATPAQSLGAVLAEAGAYPDTDKRNQARLVFDSEGRPERDRWGELVPFEPTILNMGKVTGLSSQAHAHYGLPPGPKSSDPDVLKTEPWRFALPAGWPAGPVETVAAQMAQDHVDLALLARGWAGPGAAYLEAVFAGAGLHYLGDVGNQIHTVQVGLYDFFVRAKLEYWKRAALTAGGYIAPLESWTSVGLKILKNHHLLSERIFQHFLEAAVAGREAPASIQQAIAAFGTEDPSLLQGFRCGPDFAADLVGRLIERSAPEGGELYRLSALSLSDEVRSYGVEVPDPPPDPLAWGGEGEGAKQAVLDMLALQAKAAPRLGTLIRAYMGCLASSSLAPAEIQGRLIRRRLDALERSAERREIYRKDPPRGGSDTIRSPAWLLADLGLLAGLGLVLAWLVRRRSETS